MVTSSTVTASTLRLTKKENVRIELYRTINLGTSCYLVVGVAND